MQYEAVVLRSGSMGVSKQEYPKRVYPRHCAFGGFIVSREVVRCMYGALRDTPVLKFVGGYGKVHGLFMVHKEKLCIIVKLGKISRFYMKHRIKIQILCVSLPVEKLWLG